jgi:putative MFS transporter
MLDVFSFIAGCGIGGDLVTIGSVFIEFCPPCKSWRFTLLNAICAIGGVLIPLLAFAYSASGTPQGWRWVTLTFGAINLIAWALRFFMYETPKFLISTGKAGRAE